MQYKDRVIGFAANLVPLVKNGSKKLTYRLGDKYSFLKASDTILVKDSSDSKIFGEIKITKASQTTFKDLPIDIDKHEKYSSKEEQRKVFETYYPGQVTDNAPIVVLEYEFLGEAK